MLKIISMIGNAGFFICLFIIYATKHGIKGIRKYNTSFQLLDMRFHYKKWEVYQTLGALEEAGRNAYLRYIVLDFIFISCFLILMITVSTKVVVWPNVKMILIFLCVLRALFDILENICIILMLTYYPVMIDKWGELCGWFTTFKFIMLYTWLFTLLLIFGIDFRKKIF